VHAMLPIRTLRRGQSQKHLVNQCRRLQCVLCGLSSHTRLRLPPQLVIEDGVNLRLRSFIALAPAPQQHRDVATRSLAHGRLAAILRSRNALYSVAVACGSRGVFYACFNVECLSAVRVFAIPGAATTLGVRYVRSAIQIACGVDVADDAYLCNGAISTRHPR